VVWALLIAILSDLFFRGSFPLKNLAFFSVFVGLSAPQYHELPNPLGSGSLLFDGALILLTHYRLRGGRIRYVTALIVLGVVPLIQFVGVMLAAGVVAGLIVGHFVLKGTTAMREIALAALVPACVAALGYALTIGSWSAFTAYVRSSTELASGYNLAMSLRGPPAELIAGLEAIALVAVVGGGSGEFQSTNSSIPRPAVRGAAGRNYEALLCAPGRALYLYLQPGSFGDRTRGAGIATGQTQHHDPDKRDVSDGGSLSTLCGEIRAEDCNRPTLPGAKRCTMFGGFFRFKIICGRS